MPVDLAQASKGCPTVQKQVAAHGLWEGLWETVNLDFRYNEYVGLHEKSKNFAHNSMHAVYVYVLFHNISVNCLLVPDLSCKCMSQDQPITCLQTQVCQIRMSAYW